MNWIKKIFDRIGAPTGASIAADIAAISGVNSFQEVIPASVFSLAAIPTTLVSPPPAPTAANKVVTIDAVADTTFCLRSLFVNVTSFGTGTTLTFSLWAVVNAVLSEIDTSTVSALGYQNLMDLFGLQEVCSSAIYVTVIGNVGNTGACSGTYQYASAK
jgi:hypothetical protein